MLADEARAVAEGADALPAIEVDTYGSGPDYGAVVAEVERRRLPIVMHGGIDHAHPTIHGCSTAGAGAWWLGEAYLPCTFPVPSLYLLCTFPVPSLYLLQDATELIAVFGEPLVRGLYSKVWSLRQSALSRMAEVLPSLGGDGRAVVHATCQAVSRCTSDKMVQVELMSMALFSVLFTLPAVGALPGKEWLGLTQSMTASWVGKLGHHNPRVREAVSDALLAVCRLPQCGPHNIAAELLKPISATDATNARLMIGRLSLLHTFLSDFPQELSEHAKEAMRAIKTGLSSASADVRTKATEVAQQLHRIIGDLSTMSDFLSDLNPATRDALLITLQTDDQGYSPPRPPPSRVQAQHNQHQEKRSGGSKARHRRSSGSPTHHAGSLASGHGGPSERGSEIGEAVEVDETRCQFCGLHDPAFNEEKLDLHFWKDCPLLMSCEQCGQIVEIIGMSDHLVDECDMSLPFRYAPPLTNPGYRGCPLCQIDLPDDLEACRDHIMHHCPKNPRTIG